MRQLESNFISFSVSSLSRLCSVCSVSVSLCLSLSVCLSVSLLLFSLLSLSLSVSLSLSLSVSIYLCLSLSPEMIDLSLSLLNNGLFVHRNDRFSQSLLNNWYLRQSTGTSNWAYAVTSLRGINTSAGRRHFQCALSSLPSGNRTE